MRKEGQEKYVELEVHDWAHLVTNCNSRPLAQKLHDNKLSKKVSRESYFVVYSNYQTLIPSVTNYHMSYQTLLPSGYVVSNYHMS